MDTIIPLMVIRDRIDISTIKHDLTFMKDGMCARWKAIEIGEAFKRRKITPSDTREDIILCVKIDYQTYIELTWMGSTYLQEAIYWWPYN